MIHVRLAELLHGGKLRSVYHGEHGAPGTLKELSRSYMAITRDLTRVMSPLKAIYRSWGACTGPQVYASRYRAE